VTTTTQRTYRPESAKTKAEIQAAALELSQDSVIDFRDRVLHRLEGKPRYQSIGREKYVYVGDVAQIMDEELNKGGEE